MSERISDRQQLEFRVGAITFTVWPSHPQPNGAGGSRPTFFLEKQYKDQTTGKWRKTSYFLLEELPKLALLATRTYEHFALRIIEKRGNAAAAGDGIAG